MAAAIAVVLAAPRARAAGYLVPDISAEALGKASAVSASTREPAAIFFNPGALGFMRGYGGSVGATLALTSFSFEPADGGADTDSDNPPSVLPALFVDGALGERIRLGLSVVTFFGLRVEWPSGWVGREDVIEVKLETVTINPTVAVRLHDRVSVGAGFQVVRATVDLTSGLPALVGGTVRVGAGTWGVGGNAGVLVKALPEVLHVAAAYRSRVLLKFDGRADFDPGPEFAAALSDQAAEASLTLPDILTAGILWRPRPSVELTFDTNLTLWSVFDEVVIDFETAPDRVIGPDFHDAFTFRLGADWATPLAGLNVRGGFIFDQSPSREASLSPALPDSHRLDFCVGVGYRRGWFKADLGYLLAYFLPSESTGGVEGPVGTYRTWAHLLGLTVAARFGE